MGRWGWVLLNGEIGYLAKIIFNTSLQEIAPHTKVGRVHWLSTE